MMNDLSITPLNKSPTISPAVTANPMTNFDLILSMIMGAQPQLITTTKDNPLDPILLNTEASTPHYQYNHLHPFCTNTLNESSTPLLQQFSSTMADKIEQWLQKTNVKISDPTSVQIKIQDRSLGTILIHAHQKTLDNIQHVILRVEAADPQTSLLLQRNLPVLSQSLQQHHISHEVHIPLSLDQYITTSLPPTPNIDLATNWILAQRQYSMVVRNTKLLEPLSTPRDPALKD